MDSDREEVQRLSATLLAAVNDRDVEVVLSVWAGDGTMMPPNHPAVGGRSELEMYFTRLFATARFRFVFTQSEIEVIGDVAIERVQYTVESWRDGASEPVNDAGKGIHVFRRASVDSPWKLAVDIWNSDCVIQRARLGHSSHG